MKKIQKSIFTMLFVLIVSTAAYAQYAVCKTVTGAIGGFISVNYEATVCMNAAGDVTFWEFNII